MGDVLRSVLLSEAGFEHAFNLRTGGASAAPYASFNLGRAVGDDAADVRENHSRFAQAVGYRAGALYEVSQVHGRVVQRVAGDEDPVSLRAHEADALVTTTPGTAIGVRVADCVPVLLADADGGAVAAVHAGWRGAAAGVLEAAVEQLAQAGVRSTSLRAAIFPHIRPCCFEVGDDVAQELSEASPIPDVVDRHYDKPHVNLAAIVRAKLVVLGVGAAHVDDVAGCTRCEPQRFFSYRRDGKRSGRHLAAIIAR